ncbi:Stress-response A/B barrel domain-containing protein [Glycine soja]|uniref:Stress-response A/B barrel domain-containing protein n=1 Tax=Glycine soja TaxID=3848 RepID=A0A445H9T6_GLYSO|nr:Stress-response A/B barrel domain-containing protein [Glycine soja]
MYPPLFSLNNLVDVPSTRTDPQEMYPLLFSVTTTQVDVPSTCTTKDVLSNVLRQSSQAFNDDVAVDELIQGLKKMVSGIDHGKDIESHDMLRQGFTHVFLMAFNGKEEFNAFQTHVNDLEFIGLFSPAIEKIVVLDFPSNLMKAPA